MKAKSGVRVLCKLGCNYLSNIRSLPPSHKSTFSIPNINEGLAREKDNRSMQATTRASNFCKHNFWACSYTCGHTSLLCLPPSHRLPAFLSCEFQGRGKRPDRPFNSSHSCWNRPWSCRGGTLKKQLPAAWRSHILSWESFSLFPELATIAHVCWGERLLLSSTLPPGLRLLLCVLLLSPCCLAHTTLNTIHLWLWTTRDTGQLEKMEHLKCQGGRSPIQVLWHWHAQARLESFSELSLS